MVFDHSGDAVPVLEGAIEEHLETALGYEVRTFVRALADLERLVALDAVASAREEGFTPYVIFCRSEPDAGVRAAPIGPGASSPRWRGSSGSSGLQAVSPDGELFDAVFADVDAQARTVAGDGHESVLHGPFGRDHVLRPVAAAG